MVTIVMLNFNGLKVVSKCIDTLYRYLPSSGWNIIIKENGSTDGSYEYLCGRTILSNNMHLWASENIGNFSSMNNAAVERMKQKNLLGDYVLFLNNDIEVCGNFLGVMRQVLENRAEIGVVGAKLYYPTNLLQHGGVIFHKRSPIHVNSSLIDHMPMYKFVLERDEDYQAVTGACMMMRTSEFIALGGFDEGYDWCYDDTDLCLRATYELKKKSCVPANTHLIHHESYSVKIKDSLPRNYSIATSRLRQKFEKIWKEDLFDHI